MEELLQKLEVVLKEELAQHTILLQTEKEFNKVIKEADIIKIQQYTVLHDEQMIKIEKLEEQRILLSDSLTEMLGIKSGNPRLGTLLEKVSLHWKEKLKSIQNMLKNVIEELTIINTSNKILLQEGLLLVSSTVKMFQKPDNKFAQYGIKGKSTSSPVSRSLVNRIA